jgi:hypothetical protein
MSAVRKAVEADLAEIAETGARPASAGLQEVARVLAAVLDGDAPAMAKVQASKTLMDVLVRLAGPASAASGAGDASVAPVQHVAGHQRHSHLWVPEHASSSGPEAVGGPGAAIQRLPSSYCSR